MSASPRSGPDVVPERSKFAEQDLLAIQQLFEHELEPSLVSWLIYGEPQQAFGLPLLGLPPSPALDNTWGATLWMRAANPELPLDLLAIRLIEDHALCVGIGPSTPSGGGMLAEVDLANSVDPVWLGKSIHEYLREARADIHRAEAVLNRVDELLEKHPSKFDHQSGGDKPRSHWLRVFRACVHDHTVGIAALLQSENLDAAVIDVFECTDHPLYERGHGVRSLMSLILADCMKAGTSLRMFFRPVPGLRPKGLPQAVEQLATTLGVEPAGKENGVIEHWEGLELLCRLSRLTDATLEKVRQSGGSEDISLQGLCALALENIWTPEEIEWLITNANEPTAVLFGEASPEDWLLFKLALSSARSAVLATIVRNAFSEGGIEGIDTCSHRVDGPLIRYRFERPTSLVWNEELEFDRGETAAALITPRLLQKDEENLISADAHLLASLAKGGARKLLVYGNEHHSTDVSRIAPTLKSLDVTLAIAPYSLRELDAVVERKWQGASAVRR